MKKYLISLLILVCSQVILYPQLGETNPSITSHDYLANDTFITWDGKKSNLQEAINELITDADSYMTQMNVSPEKQAAIREDIQEQLYALQDESERRILSDHGILHVYTNWQRSKHYLSTRPDATPEINLAILIAQVYHDTGYCVYPCNLPMFSQEASTQEHDILSSVIVEKDNTFYLYKSIFSQETLSQMLHAIRTHNSEQKNVLMANTAADSNIIPLTLNLSDKCAIFLRDKLPSMLANNPAVMQVILDYYPLSNTDEATTYNQAMLKELQTALQQEKLPDSQLARYQELITREMSIARCDSVYRLFGYVPADCLTYNSTTGQNEIILYRVTYGIKGEKKLQRKMCSKLIEDLIVPETGESEDAYNDRIKAIYKDACHPEGTLIDNTRNLHLTIKEIKAHDIPGSQFDYQLYNIKL